jgi:hypothetical protein
MIHNETHLNQIYCTVHTVCERRRVQTKACRFPTFTCPLFIKCWPAKCSAGCRGITSGNGTTIINITDSKVGLSVYTPRLFHSAMSRGPRLSIQFLFILLSLFFLRQVHSLFQSEFSTECYLMLPLSKSIILSSCESHPALAYIFFPLVSCLLFSP